jgi:hypothetical protein
MLRGVVRRSHAIQAVAWGAVAVGVAAPALRRRLRLRSPLVAAAAYTAPVALCVAVRRAKLRDVAVVCLHMYAYVAMYEMPNDDPEALERRVRVRYPVLVDRALGLGELPGVRLQRALARAGVTTRRDSVLVWTHWIWFLVPHTTAAWFLLFRHDLLGRSAAQIYAVFDVGVLFYWIVPTAPPWYAARHGEIVADPALRRLMVEHGQSFWRDRWQPLYSLFGGNPLAAMPSLHFATSVMAALVLSDAGPIQGAIGWTYALTLGFALVYLGEHYVIDLLAGLALTLTVRRLARPATPLALAAGRLVSALEERAHA